jgi:hypothetical protein
VAFKTGCCFTNWRRDQRERDARTDQRLTAVEARLSAMPPSASPAAEVSSPPTVPIPSGTLPPSPEPLPVPTPSTRGDVIPIRDEYREHTLAEERRPKPGLIGDLYHNQSPEERAAVEIRQQGKTKTAAPNRLGTAHSLRDRTDDAASAQLRLEGVNRSLLTRSEASQS